MAKPEWFRKASWSPEDQADFFGHLQRARSTSRAQYLRIQAGHLAATGAPALLESSIALLDRLISSYSEDAFLALAHTQRANCLAQLQRRNEAIEAYRAAFNATRLRPNVRPNAATDFGVFVVERHLEPLYDEALAALDEFDDTPLFPVEVYLRQGVRAILNARKGLLSAAAPAAARALKASHQKTSGLRYHSNLGLVQDLSSHFHAELLAIAPVGNARLTTSSSAGAEGGPRRRVVSEAMVEILATPGQVVAATERAIGMAPFAYPPTLPSRPESFGAPDWYWFEREAWPIGESIRHSFLRYPALKRDANVLEAIVRVVEKVNLRRGRQSFVMVLGFVKAQYLGRRIAAFLADPDIDGQVIGTLIKMKAVGFADAVRPHLQSRHAWIRRHAKRYLERFSVAA